MKRRALLALAATHLVAGCAATLATRPTAELFQELMLIRTVGFYCQGGSLRGEPDGEALERRLDALRPRLETALGAGELARIDAIEADADTLDMADCPLQAERDRSVSSFRQRVEELERRLHR